MFSAPYDSPLKQSSIVQKDVFWYPAELWKKLIQVEVTEYATTPGGAVIEFVLSSWKHDMQ